MSRYRALAIEAATDQLSLAVSTAGRILTREWRPAREHSARVFAYVRALVDEAGTDFPALDFVAFGCGPGSFTGVRLAAAVAQAIGFAAAIPVCRISSLAVLAAGAARRLGPGRFAICLDARMGQAYLALYRATSRFDLHAELPATLIDPRDFVFAGSESLVAVGPGWQACPSLLERHRSCVTAVHADIEPAAGDLLELAAGEFAAGRAVAPADALPEYLSPGPVAGVQAPHGDDRS